MPGAFFSRSNSVLFADRDYICFECGQDLPQGEPYRGQDLPQGEPYRGQDLPQGEPYRLKTYHVCGKRYLSRTFCLSGCTKNPVLNILKVKKAHRQGNDGGVAF